MHDLDHQPQDAAEDDILLPGKHITSEHCTVGSSSKRPAWVALGLPVLKLEVGRVRCITLPLFPGRQRDVQNRAVRNSKFDS
jgi:hypothetical protein